MEKLQGTIKILKDMKALGWGKIITDITKNVR